MTNINKLRVSLTKHGAHKIFNLLQHFSPNQVLSNTNNKFDGIDIDAGQARKILSANKDDSLPDLWRVAKSEGDDTLRQLVFLAILFSHFDLIRAFTVGAQSNGNGVIVRGVRIDGKAFTNTKNNIEELGFSVNSNSNIVEYNIASITQNKKLSRLAYQLFRLKLTSSGWNGEELENECIKHEFHTALSCSEQIFRIWLAGNTSTTPNESGKQLDLDTELSGSFQFKSGHIPRKEGEVSRNNAKNSGSAELLHNLMQTMLYKILSELNGSANVGTEVSTGSSGTSVDVVVQKNHKTCYFYEIKTAVSLKNCIRQALPQLVEYAYWPNNDRAKKLIIVSPNPVTNDAKIYLKNLRDRFSLPIYYQYLDIDAEKLSELE